VTFFLSRRTTSNPRTSLRLPGYPPRPHHGYLLWPFSPWFPVPSFSTSTYLDFYSWNFFVSLGIWHPEFRHIIFFFFESCNRLPPLLREAASHVFIFQIFVEREMRWVYESYGIRFKSFEEFRDYIQHFCKNHYFVLYTKVPPGNDVPNYQVLKVPVFPKFGIKF
jgi:hypothetical protein